MLELHFDEGTVDCSPKICLLLSAVVWLQNPRPEREELQEETGAGRRHVALQQKAAGGYHCNKDDDRQARLTVQPQSSFQKSRAPSVVRKPHFKLTETKQSEGE